MKNFWIFGLLKHFLFLSNKKEENCFHKFCDLNCICQAKPIFPYLLWFIKRIAHKRKATSILANTQTNNGYVLNWSEHLVIIQNKIYRYLLPWLFFSLSSLKMLEYQNDSINKHFIQEKVFEYHLFRIHTYLLFHYWLMKVYVMPADFIKWKAVAVTYFWQHSFWKSKTLKSK